MWIHQVILHNKPLTKLRNKTILIVSPQLWGNMQVSKHHYALELAARGNTVYFLNPPDQSANGKSFINIDKSDQHPGLFIITHRLFFPYRLKFHAMPVFHWLMKYHIKKLLRNIGKSINIVWSFDLNNLYPFRYFPKTALKIFHPVDEPLTSTAIDAAKGADVIFSVTREILDKYASFGVGRHLINHGVTENFIGQVCEPYNIPSQLRVGFSGNLLRGDIDRTIFLEIVQQNQHVNFDCWGSYSIEQSNIGGDKDMAAATFIDTLCKQKNVQLHGPLKPALLAQEMKKADAFFICYDVEKDQSKGTNYHKIMEYLGTGKVVISNNVTAYKLQSELVQMVAERDTNCQLPVLFKDIISNLSVHNAVSMQKKRIAFAEANTYQHQISKIEMALFALKPVANING